MSEIKLHKIDSVKATLFTLAVFFITLCIFIWMFIPLVKEIKVAVMRTERTKAALQMTKAEVQIRIANFEQTKEYSQSAVRALARDFSIETFQADLKGFSAQVNIDSMKLISDEPRQIDRISFTKFDIETQFDSPSQFYILIDYLNSYKNIAAVTFPISIKADEQYRLKWRFGLDVYRTLMEQ